MSPASWTWRESLRGVIPPMISPLTASFDVDAVAVHRVVDHILDGGCSGLFVLGGVGEGAWLSARQRADVVRTTVDAAAGRAPVLVGVMLPATAPARDEALRAADAGADALVVGSPYYFDPDPAAQQRHIEAIIATTPLPVLLYNIPQCTHTPLAEQTVANLAKEPRVLGVKDSWGNLPYFQSLLTLKQARSDFRVLQGNEHAAMASLLLGADGLIPGLANIVPRLLVELVDAARDNDTQRCQRIHDELFDLTRIYARGAGLPGLYAAAARLGLCENVPAEPWQRVGTEAQQSIDAILREHAVAPAKARV